MDQKNKFKLAVRDRRIGDLVVPRDRIELSTPAFSGLTENKCFQELVRFGEVKQLQIGSCKIKGLQVAWAVA